MCKLALHAAVAGRWTSSSHTKTIPDPLNGQPFVQLPDTQRGELDHFVQSLQACPKTGLHNPLKNPERSVTHDPVLLVVPYPCILMR
jgi:1-pyrroline-5-carboxylate dehydrogenase